MVQALSLTALRVLRAFLDAKGEPQYGLALSRVTGIKAGSLYPILSRFESARWVTGAWEDIDEAVEGRRRRRFYSLTGAGENAARRMLANATDQLSPAGIRSRRVPNSRWRPT
jgi:PadR family transcriptional regulator, regulatory protein PadR